MDFIESSGRSFLKVRKIQFGIFVCWRQFSQILFNSCFTILACSFPMRVLTNCQIDWIALKVILKVWNIIFGSHFNEEKPGVIYFTEFSILFSSTEVLSNFISSGNPKNNGVESTLIKGHFHGSERCNLYLWSIICDTHIYNVMDYISIYFMVLVFDNL